MRAAPSFLPALLAALAPAQYREPEVAAPWVGYDINVYPKGIEIWDAVGADFDGDGVPDLAAVSWHPNPELSILFGDGRGGYFEPVRLPLSLGSLGVAAADFDRDGDLDLVVSDTGQRWEGTSFTHFRNDGARRFALGGRFACGRGPSGITAADFNGDGAPDVAVAHDDYIAFGQSIAVVFGDGAGGFGPPTILGLTPGTYDIEAADWDGDGDVDLVVGHEQPRVTLLRNQGGGSFVVAGTLTPLPMGSVFREPDLLLGDPDGDGDIDVLYSGAGSVNSARSGFVNLFRNRGGGTFGAPERLDLPEMDGASGLWLADVDQDGALDLLAADGLATWAWLRGDGMGGFLAARSYRAGHGPFRFVIGDLDRDGHRDVTVVARGSNTPTSCGWRRRSGSARKRCAAC